MKLIALNPALYHDELIALKKELIVKNELIIKPHSFFKDYHPETIRILMHFEALYSLPTQELINFLKSEIEGYKAIEICCGSGSIGKALNIPATDSKLQEKPEIKMHYELMGQPPIKYPSHVKKYEAMDAVKKSKAEVVIGSYVTKQWDGRDGNYWAPNEPAILKRIKKYIHIGDLKTHAEKPLMQMDYILLQPEWLIVRGNQGYIGIWTN